MVHIKEEKGVTLIELLIALVISAILIAAIFQTFIRQQKSYTLQEQVVDMQQNVRGAIGQMMREIRMAGFGIDITHDRIRNRWYREVLDLTGGVNGFTEVITPMPNEITIVFGNEQISTLAVEALKDQKEITLPNVTHAKEFYSDDRGPKHRYISIGGTESNTVQSRSESVLTLVEPLKYSHKLTDLEGKPHIVPIFKIRAITYRLGISNDKPVLQRNENTDGGNIALAENIEGLQFEYFDANGNPTANPRDIRMIRVTVTARTDMRDPEFKGGGADGFRRRTITSNIHLRNMGLD